MVLGIVLGSVSAFRQVFGFALEVDEVRIKIREQTMGRVHRVETGSYVSLNVAADCGRHDTFSIKIEACGRDEIEIAIQTEATVDELVADISAFVPTVTEVRPE